MVTNMPDIHDDLSEPLAAPVDERLLARIVKRITQLLPRACVVLFGSYAQGQPTATSDVDLLVVADLHEDPLAVAGELYGRLRPRRFALDLIVLTPKEVRRRRAEFDPFLEDAVSRGRVLYGKLP